MEDEKADPALQLNVEVWKKIVDVQQHFNTIGWQIRALAITALTFTLGATFFGYLNADDVTVVWLAFNPSVFVPLLGLAIWLLFWFADGIWYHRLLSGAGIAAGPVEEVLRSHGVEAGLSGAITSASHRPWLGARMTSTRKLHIFYCIGAAILFLTTVVILALTGRWVLPACL